MIEIYSNKQFSEIYKLYSSEIKKFTFISSVLSGIQKGRVWVDSEINPKTAFICHDFGWAQLIGNASDHFSQELKKFLFEKQLFSSFKLRIFSPRYGNLFAKYCELSERQQFQLEKRFSINQEFRLDNVEIVLITPENANQVNDSLGLDFFQRNWPSKEAFYSNSFGYYAKKGDTPISICYSCASMNEVKEIDVLTSKEYQGMGLAKVVCSAFIKSCLEKNYFPAWDCFTNNTGSMMLSKSLGFKPLGDPYQFFTYNRKP